MPETEKMTALVQFAGEVAQELNSIFSAVSGELSCLDEQVRKGMEHSQTVRDIAKSVDRGLVLSSRLQAFAGRQPLKRRRTDINRLVGEAVCEFRETLTGSVDVDFTPAPESCTSFVDDEKLWESVVELFTNATTAMNGVGSMQIKVAYWNAETESNATCSGPSIEIRVSDTGPGMGTDVMVRATEPMFSTKPAHVDVGWGLSKCAGLVRQSGGEMKIRSGIGSGTTVSLFLPAERPAGGAEVRYSKIVANH